MKGVAAMTLLATLSGAAPLRADEIDERIAIEPGGRLRVELSSGSIEVETHDAAEVTLEARASGWPRFEFELRYDEEEVELVGRHRGWLPFGGSRVRVVARVPQQFDLDLRTSGGRIDVQELDGRVRATTSGGPIVVEDVAGDVEIETSGGPITVQELEGSLRAETSGGEIRVSEVTGRTDVRTSGGGIRIQDAGGPVEARTSGGSVAVSFDGAPAGRLETSGGGIDVEWDADFGARVDAETSGGRIEIDEEFSVRGHVKRTEVRADVGGSGAALEMRTSGGNIRVRSR